MKIVLTDKEICDIVASHLSIKYPAEKDYKEYIARWLATKVGGKLKDLELEMELVENEKSI